MVLACCALHEQRKGMTKDVLVKFAQDFGEKLYFAGFLDHYEAVSRDSLTNAVDHCLEYEMLRKLPVEKVGTVFQVNKSMSDLVKALRQILSFRNVPDTYDLQAAINF